MIRVTKITALVLLLTCSHTYSGTMGSFCFPGSQTIECKKTGWDVEIAALYLRPSFGGNGLGYSSYGNYNGADNNGIQIGTSGTPNPVFNALPKWDWGFQLEGAYLFNDNDLTLQWSHLRDNTKTSLPHNTLFAGSVDGFYANRINVFTQWDELNLELGHHTYFNDRKKMRFYAGVEYANIMNTITNYPLLHPDQNPIMITVDKLNYDGVGPRVGGDFDYAATQRFNVYLNGALSILVGTSKEHVSGYHDVLDFYGLDPYGIPNYDYSHRNSIVSELKAKLGAKYCYPISKGILTFDVGYLWIDYMHAISSYTGVGIVGSSYGNKNSANYNLNGLSLGLKWNSDE